MPSPSRLSYAQARLILGMSNVGFWVCLASAILFWDLAARLFPTYALTGEPLLWTLVLFLSGYVALQAPFDLFGGYLLPRSYRRNRMNFSDFSAGWLRGVTIQSGLLLAISWSLLKWPADTMKVAAAWMFLLLLLQTTLARMIGQFKSRGDTGWKSFDEAFTGGIAGLPGLQKAIFVTGRGPRLRQFDERRRHLLRELSLPTAGLVIALTFNLLGLLLASSLIRYPLDTVCGLVELSLGFTLWSFLGLLVLPSLSRPAVYAGDYALYAKGFTREDFERSLEQEPSQSGESQRSHWVETIFHPVPSTSNRIAHWGRPPGWTGAWHAARYAIYLSWAGLSLLNRAVHCNIGKPNVWVLLPCD